MKTTVTIVAALAALTLPSLVSCSGDEPASTAGKRVTLKTTIKAAGSAFTTGLGWQLELSRALVATGPFYYFDGSPAVRPESAQQGRFLRHLLGSGVAHAHPGHYVAGTAMGQMLVPTSVDLLAGSTVLAPGEGVTGVFRSAAFSFSKGADGPLASALGGASVAVSGRATKGDKTVFFSVSATFDQITTNATEGRIDGCPFDEANVDDSGSVTVTVQPGLWLNLIDFSPLDGGTEAAPTVLPAGSKEQQAFATGLVQIAAYRFRYSKE